MKETQKWLRLDGDDGWQVVLPETDIQAHSVDREKRELASFECPCKPRVDMENKILIHNSFEQMQKVDEALKKIIA